MTDTLTNQNLTQTALVTRVPTQVYLFSIYSIVNKCAFGLLVKPKAPLTLASVV